MTKSVSQARSHNYLRQVRGSVLFKGGAVACSLFSIPLMIHYLGQAQFGVWSTLLSVMAWITFFDLGLGNGLRNKLAESLAKDQTDEARSYISSAYSLIGLISLALFLILALAAFTVPWQKVFNIQLINAEKLSYAVLITGFFIAFNFWLSLINSVLNALQKTSVVVLGQFLCSALSLILVYVLTRTTDASLLYLATVYGISMVGANALLSGWFYKSNPVFIPKLSLDFSDVRPLLGLGLQFFVIQIAVLVIFTTDKIIITQLLGPYYVTQYEVVSKLFSVVMIAFSLLVAPLWSSYTDAYHRNDLKWIRNALRKQIHLVGFSVLIVALICLIAPGIIRLWIGSEVQASLPLIVSVGAYTIISIWNGVFAYIVNGIGATKVQMITSVLAVIVNIPLAIALTKWGGMGVEGVVWSNVFCLMFFAVAGSIQVYQLINKPTIS